MREEEREEEGVAGKEERRQTCWRVEHVKGMNRMKTVFVCVLKSKVVSK